LQQAAENWLTVAYEVDAQSARSLGVHYFRSSGRLRSGQSEKQKSCAASTKCGGKKQGEDTVDQSEILDRVSSLNGVSILVVNRALHAYSALALKEAGIFPIQVESPEFIGVVIAHLQEMLRSDTPLWLRRTVARTAPEQKFPDLRYAVR
jgi:hypothetical protein